MFYTSGKARRAPFLKPSAAGSKFHVVDEASLAEERGDENHRLFVFAESPALERVQILHAHDFHELNDAARRKYGLDDSVTERTAPGPPSS